MMNLRTPSVASRRCTAVRWSFAWLFLVLSSLATWAGVGPAGQSPSSDPATNASSPGEEVTSLPIVNDVSGLTLVGTLRELRGLGLAIHGQGRIDVLRVERRFVVTFVGDFRIDADRAALARSSVEVLFRGGVPFAGGIARLQIGGTAPVLLDSARVPLPLARLAGMPRALGELVTLEVFSPAPHRAHVVASYGATSVTLTQRMR